MRGDVLPGRKRRLIFVRDNDVGFDGSARLAFKLVFVRFNGVRGKLPLPLIPVSWCCFVRTLRNESCGGRGRGGHCVDHNMRP